MFPSQYHPIELPPLRERREDIPLLIRRFFEKYTAKIGKKIRGIAPDVMAFLESYSYPSNVRELENVIERGVVFGGGDIIRNEDLELWDCKNGQPQACKERIPVNAEEFKEMKRHLRDHAIESLETAFVKHAWNATIGILRGPLRKPES